MIVVADATPINVLVRVECIDVLPRLYGRILIPQAVSQELAHHGTPVQVKEWIASSPSWMEVCTLESGSVSAGPHRGEREAIELARSLRADLLLVDDKRARQAALQAGLAITGTLGVLAAAGKLGLIDLQAAIQRLRQTDFFISEELLDSILRRHD